MKTKLIASALMAGLLAIPAVTFADDHDDHRYAHEDRGAGPHGYHRGDHLRAEDHRSEYVVNDWHARHLREPPHGYHWVQHGDDYVLAAIAGGVIADVILHH
jgi:Ni/Co efflux regulator RcnB